MNLKIKSLIFIVIFTALAAVNAFAQNKYTPFSVSGTFQGAWNLYNSDFTSLPGIDNCCSEFNGGVGIGFSANIGLSYRFKKFPLFAKSTLNSELFYKDYSGQFKESSFFGNVIIGNTAYKGISEHLIKTSAGIIGLEESLSLYPFAKVPIGIRLGIFAGTCLSCSFEQKETLLEPANVNFENGRRVRNEKSGALPNKTTIMTGANISLSYELYNNGNLTLSPVISYEYLFSGFIKDFDWNASSVRAGLAAAWKISKSKKLPPPPPPVPAVPEPPKPAILELAFVVNLKNNSLNDNDSVYFSYTETVYKKVIPIQPRLFYTQNETEPKNAENIKISSNSDYQLYALNSIIEFMKDNPTVKADIAMSVCSGDDSKDGRIKYLTDKLGASGISKERLNFDVSYFDFAKLKHSELAEDLNYAYFNFSDGTKILYYDFDSLRTVNAEKLDFNISIKTESNAKPVVIKGEIDHRGTRIFDFNENKAVYTIQENNVLSSYLPDRNKLTFSVKVQDAALNSKLSEKSIFIIPRNEKRTINENVIKTDPDSAVTIEYILGFFEFDETEFFAVNDSALEKIRYFADNDASIEIIPSTDNFGTESYNRNLALKRAATAVKLISRENARIKTTLPDEYFYDNLSASGRMFNRSVIVRIKK